jgi:hypothetical protein
MMKLLFNVYRNAVGYSILRYFLYYLQVDKGVKASDFLHVLSDRVQRRRMMPHSHVRLIRSRGHLPKGGYDVPDAIRQWWPASPPAVL